MPNVEVFRFKKYDITTDQMVPSRRYGMRHTIESIGGVVDEASATRADESFVKGDIYGLGAIDAEPEPPQTGFQRSVR